MPSVISLSRSRLVGLFSAMIFKLDFATKKEAEQFASDMDWRYVDENQFEWRLAVEEDATAEKQAIKNRHTEEVEAESISYAVCK